MWQHVGAVFALGTLTLGCLGVPLSSRGGARDAGPADLGVTVLGEAELANEHGTLLDAMVRNVPSIQVGDLGRCPALSLRGPNTMPGIADPKVYVDGARAVDTCILTMLYPGDVERVEVYPMGVTTRPGYAPHAHGLILVFMRDGSS